MSNEPRTPTDDKWADIALIADAAYKYFEVRAYLVTGGSDGCALCGQRSFEERIEAGHFDCAKAGVAWKAAHDAVSREIDLDIDISRVFDDPRLFQWLDRTPA